MDDLALLALLDFLDFLDLGFALGAESVSTSSASLEAELVIVLGSSESGTPCEDGTGDDTSRSDPALNAEPGSVLVPLASD